LIDLLGINLPVGLLLAELLDWTMIRKGSALMAMTATPTPFSLPCSRDDRHVLESSTGDNSQVEPFPVLSNAIFDTIQNP
jgi:hypothetical protein